MKHKGTNNRRYFNFDVNQLTAVEEMKVKIRFLLNGKYDIFGMTKALPESCTLTLMTDRGLY